MKASKYNIYYREGNRFYVYNQLTCALCEFDEELFSALKENSLSGVPEEMEEELLRNHFVCDDTLQEEMILLKKNRDNRFGNRHAKITVMPTLDCNFRCWYCYEDHCHGKMDAQMQEATVRFCKDIIDSHPLDVFSLDWFGGEPLLFFREVVYPVSK